MLDFFTSYFHTSYYNELLVCYTAVIPSRFIQKASMVASFGGSFHTHSSAKTSVLSQKLLNYSICLPQDHIHRVPVPESPP